MTVHPQDIRGGPEEAGRKRKSHKKSRRGCRNCKLRRVKCDEASPECKKCINFGVTCNYDSKIPDLQMCVGRHAAPALMNRKSGKEPFMVNPEILGDGLHQFPTVPSAPYPVLDMYSSFQLDKQSLGLLDRFQSRTILTLGTSRTAPVYQMVSVREAMAHPYLMHIVMTLTSIHDRYLDPASNGKPTVTELHHWSQGASLLNRKLSQPLPSDDRDSLWTAASLLGAIAFASVDASRPEESWPLKESDASDLQWLRMSEGKMIIWELANPLRPESAFYKLALELVKDNLFSDRSSFELEDVPEAFYSIYGLDKSSNDENNAYYSAIRTLSTLIHMECNHTTIAKYLSFMSHMGKEFKVLVGQKEPRALLLLAFWFGRVSHGTWWVSQRASLEGRSVCMYLEKYHSHEMAIMELLELPKRDLGLVA